MSILFWWCFGIALFIGYFFSIITHRQRNNGENVGTYLFGVPFMSFIIGGLFSIVIWIFGRDNMERVEKPYRTENLITLDTGSELRGSFFLGSGFVGSSLYYHYYYMTPDGAKYERVSAEAAFVREYDGAPKVVKYGWFDKDSTSLFYKPTMKYEGKYILYIPKGTIKTNFKIN